jgi:hypothetical protein
VYVQPEQPLPGGPPTPPGEPGAFVVVVVLQLAVVPVVVEVQLICGSTLSVVQLVIAHSPTVSPQ